jgi:cell wall-associated NlpC family hydrolase
MGVELPRNTGDQASSPALAHRAFTAADDHAARMRAITDLRTGDLVYIPGHVMMVLGWYRGAPYVIHDTAGIAYRDGAALRARKLNAVAVTPLLPLLFADGTSYIDHITRIVRVGH